MLFTPPSTDDLERIADRLHFEFSEENTEFYEELTRRTLEELERVHELSEPQLAPTSDETARGDAYRPDVDENPHNAWITKCHVERTRSGSLADKTVGLKDSISLAGVEMTCGSRLLEGYIPNTDATVVDRLLEAGATVKGKCNMESFSFSASSDTSDYGVVTNPHDPDRIAGGSSSGSAVAVATREVDIALGCDQGASIRVPASCCGVVGLDPTTGLVPYTGIFPMDPTIDHVGPMARTVEEVAETLEVIAGRDGIDPRQPDDVPTDTYTDGLREDVADLRIGVLTEGFEVEDADHRVNDVVRDAIDEFSELGGDIVDVSLPLHHESITLAYVIWAYGGLQTFKHDGQGLFLDGWYDTKLMEAFGKFRRSRANDLSEEGKATLMAMEYLDEQYGATTYGRVQNIRHQLREQVDELFESVDLLALPTMPSPPLKLASEGDGVEHALRTITLCRNTATTSLTKHPSISIPCGTVDGVPVGLMLVGDHFDERTLLRAAYTFQQRVGGKHSL